MVKGVYTNKQDFVDAILNIPDISLIQFKDVLGYEQKKFNYHNVRNLLNISHINDCFMLKIFMNDDTVRVLEVVIKMTNTKLDI
ncbi:hypothetical protein [Tenacibaculum phage PTm5]|nr:hypothetical protein [Tenacibaculum phage PTm5]